MGMSIPYVRVKIHFSVKRVSAYVHICIYVKVAPVCIYIYVLTVLVHI